jgi:predicted Zn-dependent protease
MLRRGFVTIGLQHLEKGKQLGADGPQTRAWLALALAEAGITDKAIEMAEQVVGSERTNGIGKALIGELKLRAGRIDEAEKDLAAAADSVDPKLRPMVRLARAQALLAKNDVAGAQPLLDEVKKSGDFAYRAYAIEARYHQQAGVRAKADAILAEGRAKFPDNGLLLALEIRDLEERKQFSKALGILKTEQQRNPKALLPRLLLSDVYDSDNSRPLGIATLEEALRQFPNEASLKWRLADKMLTAGRLKDAGVYIAELAGEKSINKSAIDYLAARHASLDGKPEKATQIIREALEKDKDNPSLKLLIGQIEARNHNFTEAARNLKQVSEAQNGRYGPTKALFETLLCDGKTVEAAEVLRKAESNGLAEPIRPLRRHLLRLLAQRELHAELKREIADLLSRNPVDVDVALVINLLQGMGEGAKADALLTESLKKAPDSAILQEVRIAIMIDKKRYREAQGELSELFRQEKFKKNPTLHTLRIRADIAQNDLAGASKLCDAALARENCPGNPALIALKVQLLLRLKQQTEAESFAENSKRDFPRLPAAKYLLARAYEAVGNSEQAFKLLSELLETDPGDANASHHYLRMLIARGQFGNLEPSIENFIAANKGKEKQGENPLLLGVLAEFHATRNDLPKAETVLRRLEQQPNAGVIVAYLRGVVAFQKGETAVAEKALQVAMADPMGHTPSTFMFAQIRAQQGKLDESLRLLNQIARNPEAPAAVPLVRAQLLHRMKKTQEAETACREYLSAHPSARPFRQLLTSILLDRKDPAAREEALQLARQALGEGVENPFDFEVYLTVLFQADKANEALQILAQQAIARNKNDLALAGGRACFNAGLYREAERYAKKIVHDEPNHQNARLLYGDALSRMAAAPETGAAERDATFNRAAEQYRDVLRLSKNNVVAANNLAWTLGVQLGRPHRALEELRDAFPQALNLNNKELPAEFLDTVGVLHLKMDRLSDAQRFLEEAVARKATAVESLIHLGEVYKKQDRPDRARQVLEQARKFDSKGEHAKRIETMMAN